VKGRWENVFFIIALSSLVNTLHFDAAAFARPAILDVDLVVLRYEKRSHESVPASRPSNALDVGNVLVYAYALQDAGADEESDDVAQEVFVYVACVCVCVVCVCLCVFVCVCVCVCMFVI